MSRIAIKICGLSTPETVEAALKGGASHVGFVHFAKSPRHLEIDRLAALARRAPDHVGRVAVLVQPDDALLAAIAPHVDIVQLHGDETPERAAAIRARFGRTLWKAIPVKTRADLAAGSAYAGAVDMLLYDAKTPKGADLPGGMGLRFDWDLLAGFRPPAPWGLSGGLDADNVAEAIRITGAPLVDVSSGVESAPGIKDVDKIAAFCNAVSTC
ncbi:MAG: phosphoribosylanthranilate isomerase [Sphingobium phenoxybenzoativorans]|uniref:N-(5'-phosphoribosyl)anthranilate isomerase n=1 Tax=Sphingobium phenoxybenzoativorans TaxID=1592790 RepID=A0A975K3E0_9SPHN|nr:phosphoribosylanthranilate isomerase [Sphingobium phenoxybenzoativorans]QUT03842.1 phosphoribosylanthranilate isomerase [Sphingobium phenoxybenzoativorans]